MSDATRASGEPAEPACSHETPVIRVRANGQTNHTASVTAIPLGAEQLTSIATSKWGAANESPLGSTSQQEVFAHHGNHFVLQELCGPAGGLVGAQVYSCSSALDREPRIISQEGPTAASISTENDTGGTPGSASRKWAVDTSVTESGDIMSLFHSGADPGTHSPEMSSRRTQMHLERQGLEGGEGRPGNQIRGAALGKDARSAVPHRINSDSGVDDSSLKGAPMVLDGSISSHFPAPSHDAEWTSASLSCVAGDEECKMTGAYARSGWADPQQSSSTGAAVVDNLRKSPSLLECNGNLVGASDTLLSTVHTAPSMADTTAGKVSPASLQEAYETPESQQMRQGLLPALKPSLGDNSGAGAGPSAALGLSGCGGTAAVSALLSRSPVEVASFTSPPPTAIRNDDDVEAKGKICEGPAQTADTATEVTSQIQCSSDRRVPYQCNSAAPPPTRLQRINSDYRSTLENHADSLDGGRASDSVQMVSVRSPTVCLKPVADGCVSFRSSNSSLLPSLATSCFEESETSNRQVSAVATEHDARVSVSCDAARIRSGHAGRLAARSGVHLSPATIILPYPSHQPGVLAAEVLKSKASTVHQHASTSSPGMRAVQPPASTASGQDPEPRPHSHPQSPGSRTNGSDGENGKSVRGAAAATHPPDAAATVNAVERERDAGSPSMSTCTHCSPNEKDEGEDVSGAATALAPASVTSAVLPLQSIQDVSFDKAPEPLMEQCCLNPILLNVTSGGPTVTTVTGPRGGSDTGSKSGNGIDVLCFSPPFSVERQAYAGVLPSSNAVTCPPLSSFEAQGNVCARVGLAPPPDTVTANGELSSSTSSRVFVNGSPTNFEVTTVANRSWSTPGCAEQHPQQLSARSLIDSAPTAPPNDDVRSSSRLLHRGTEQTNFDCGDGNSSSNCLRGLDRSLFVDSSAAEDDAMWGEPTSSPLTPAPQSPAKAAMNVPARHVTFADPVTTDFVEPPPSPWAGSDYFFSPDYAYMEYKGSEMGSLSEQQQLAGVPLVDGEEDKVLRSVPHFRFRHRSEHAPASSSLPGVAVQLRTLPWEAWSRGSDGVRSGTSSMNSGEDTPTESCATQAQQLAKAAELTSSKGGREEGKTECAVAQRSQRVFFTKERLASRAALMQSRRAAVQTAGSTDLATAAAAARRLPEPGSSSAPLLRPPPPATLRSGYGGPTLPIRLAPSSTAAANTISLALPDFASPLRSTSAFTRHGSNAAQALPFPSPGRDTRAVKNADDVDDFGGWVQQQHTASTRPLPGVTAFPTASQPLTKEHCKQLLASLDGGSVPVPQSAAPPAVDTERVVDVLRDIFSSIAATSDSLHGEPLLPDAPPVLISANGTSPANLSTPRESLSSVGRVLEALSFTSLTSRVSEVSLAKHCPSLPQVSFDSRSGGQSFAASAGVASAVPNDGYVVPWLTPTTAVGVAPLEVVSASIGGKGVVRSVDGLVACASAEMAIPQEADVEDSEDASVNLTRQRLFPSNAHSASPHRIGTAALSVASFLGSRRLPDAPTAAQWTESDVVLAVLQEQRRMARENDAVAEAERLENVLRTAYS